MDEPIWGLVTTLPGALEKQIHGFKEPLQAAFDRFENGEWGENDRFTVEGFCNSADRAPLKQCFKLSEVISMSLYLEN